MKKVTMAAFAVSGILALASCNNSTSTDTPPADVPATFTGQGIASVASKGIVIPAATPLTTEFAGNKLVIGTINPDLSVNVSISPDQVKKLENIPFTKLKTRLLGSCDASAINVAGEGGTVYRFMRGQFTLDGKEYSVFPMQPIKNADNTVTWTGHQFWYATAPATVKGTANCNGVTTDFDLALKAGWNQVTGTYTNGTDMPTTNIKYRIVAQSNTYNGTWAIGK